MIWSIIEICTYIKNQLDKNLCPYKEKLNVYVGCKSNLRFVCVQVQDKYCMRKLKHFHYCCDG